MAILTDRQQIGKYEVARLIKENSYCETYRVEDEQGTPFFLKLFVLKNTPENCSGTSSSVREHCPSTRPCASSPTSSRD